MNKKSSCELSHFKLENLSSDHSRQKTSSTRLLSPTALLKRGKEVGREGHGMGKNREGRVRKKEWKTGKGGKENWKRGRGGWEREGKDREREGWRGEGEGRKRRGEVV